MPRSQHLGPRQQKHCASTWTLLELHPSHLGHPVTVCASLKDFQERSGFGSHVLKIGSGVMTRIAQTVSKDAQGDVSCKEECPVLRDFEFPGVHSSSVLTRARAMHSRPRANPSPGLKDAFGRGSYGSKCELPRAWVDAERSSIKATRMLVSAFWAGESPSADETALMHHLQAEAHIRFLSFMVEAAQMAEGAKVSDARAQRVR